VQLERILETVLYYRSGQEEDLARFYGDILRMHRVDPDGLAFRLGGGLLLFFDADRAALQSKPPPHGAHGSIHTCFVAAREDYADWKRRLLENSVPILDEIEWGNGVNSFYFHDPAGNLLEIADGDLWPPAG
jgi:catechol 2,3-dioxygenase-like lactoylglutathione lyase family enzyme